MNRLFISLVFAGAVCLAAPNPPPGGANGAPPPGSPQQGQKRAPQGGRSMGRTASNRGAGSVRRVQKTGDISVADQRLVDQIEAADSMDELSRLARRAASSRSADVRMAMVDALESQGERAANDIALYIADSDEDVAESAFSAWTGILGDMSRSRRVQAIRAAAQTLATTGAVQMQGPGGPQAPGGARWGNR